jgi:hypothetical protein
VIGDREGSSGTENGDGTLTVLIKATGNAVLYGANDKTIARNPGQIRIELLIDHGGTPNDPSDEWFSPKSK